ncbi:asparaginase [Corynebacterium sp. zg-331]|uniref:asparaginase n=1 Tax=unclassified Corynebacterium TaxID=2624378 RepID=UPI00128C7999|nr:MULTISPECIES: asparaginase [unclassified Corynebacterium]MBC3185235.1 asparaginase [Corynebacterium sp. zg-331]MPV51733.1 asparaginase [Corynebacterium sp. zg331]
MSTPQTLSLLTTGGTIACTTDATGALIPTLSGEDVAAPLRTRFDPEHLRLRVRALGRLDSSSLRLDEVDSLVSVVHQELRDPSVTGVIVTHGTDSLEETALALDCFHRDDRPVILTGAMRPSDAPAPDDPGNLFAACTIALDPTARGMGTLIVMGNKVLPARGTIKVDTSAPDAFAYLGPAEPQRPAPLPVAPLTGHRVDIVAAYPGAPRTLIDAPVAAGAHGLVIEAMGAGNVGTDLARGIEDALDKGVPVVVTTRAHRGEVRFDYGGPGGGASLGARGAVGAGYLRAGQARMALLVALAAGVDPRDVL